MGIVKKKSSAVGRFKAFPREPPKVFLGFWAKLPYKDHLKRERRIL